MHFFNIFNLLEKTKSNAGAGSAGIDPKVGSIPASRTISSGVFQRQSALIQRIASLACQL